MWHARDRAWGPSSRYTRGVVDDEDPVSGIEVRRGGDAAAALDGAVGAGLPVGFRVHATDAELVLISTARPRATGFLTFFSLLWNGFMAFALVAMARGGDGLPWPFLSLHLAVGAGLAYAALRAWTNTTRIEVNARGVSVTHGPLPWPGRSVPGAQLEELTVFLDTSYKVNDRPVPQWGVRAHVRGQAQPINLVTGLPEQAQADAIERHIERFLRIGDHGRARK